MKFLTDILEKIRKQIVKVLPFVNKYQDDKVYHFLTGLFVTALCLPIFAFTSYQIATAIIVGIVFIIALLKEVYDEHSYGGFDEIDIVATVLGVLPILGPLYAACLLLV